MTSLRNIFHSGENSKFLIPENQVQQKQFKLEIRVSQNLATN